MSKTIRQTATFKASPHAVYELLMDSKKHASFTGGAASISRKVGGKFSVSDGEIQGENLELVPDQKIVQTWRYSDWEVGVYSRATFALEQVGGKTRLTFTQSGSKRTSSKTPRMSPSAASGRISPSALRYSTGGCPALTTVNSETRRSSRA